MMVKLGVYVPISVVFGLTKARWIRVRLLIRVTTRLLAGKNFKGHS